MAEAWLPGVVRIRADNEGGRLSGGAPRVIWHTTESDPHETSARSVAHRVNHCDLQAHLIWNPLTGEIVQMLPATRAARVLRGINGSDPNREGRLCIQIEVIGSATAPFTLGPLHGLDALMRWLDSWGVPRRWPAGPPGREGSQVGYRAASRRHWARGGHFGHSQVPDAKHRDPGPIDVHKILQFELLVPRPRPAAVEGAGKTERSTSGPPARYVSQSQWGKPAV